MTDLDKLRRLLDLAEGKRPEYGHGYTSPTDCSGRADGIALAIALVEGRLVLDDGPCPQWADERVWGQP